MGNHKIFEAMTKEALEAPMELPFIVRGSFKAVIDAWEEIVKDKEHELQPKAERILADLPEVLKQPFTDFTLVEKHEEEIHDLFSLFFPPALTDNEIKVAALPFNDIFFNPSSRLTKILDNATEDTVIEYRNMNMDTMYIFGAVVALAKLFNWTMDFNRPTFWDIRDKNTGMMRHYRIMFNADFVEFKKNENTPELSEEDFLELIDNFEDIELWKQKIPPESFDFEGFLLINMFDVTNQEAISQLKDALLKREGLLSNNMATEISQQIQKIFNLPDLEVGFVMFNSNTDLFENAFLENWSSLTMGEMKSCEKDETFCHFSAEQLLDQQKPFIARDIESMNEGCPHQMYENLLKRGIKSYMAVPFFDGERFLGVLEIGSPSKNTLNTVTAIKLEDIVPLFDIAINRAVNEFENELEAIIQEQCTAIHPSVKWKFLQEAEKVLKGQLINGQKPTIGDLNFPEVTPLFGQIDIKGSSQLRNEAIQKDLTTQLRMARKVMESAIETEGMILFDAIRHQIKDHQKRIKGELLAGDESRILTFLKDEVYPAFRHLATINSRLKKEVEAYESQLDPRLGVLYDKRKNYEDSVNQLNKYLSDFLDSEQTKAQEIFPHYFEKYKTDGVEYNMYVGSSISRDKPFDDIYLQNLRLWQLKLMVDMENEWYRVKDELPMAVQVASMILVHNTPMSIRFRTDEKKFDVDGAYNARYEIIKKRIDKAHIKGTDERLTTPGKIAIVYTQEEDEREYMKYVEFLKAQKVISENVERVELEEVQGAAGLKAIRVEVLYKEKSANSLSDTTLEDILTSN